MRRGKTRAMAVLVVGALAVGAFAAGPAEAKKKKKPKPCPAYVPWTNAADATILKVTDKATEAAPLEATISTGPGVGGTTPEPEDGPEGALVDHAWQNIQIDPVAKTTKAFIVIEWTNPLWDYDLYVRDTNGTSVYYAAGFNPIVAVSDGTGNGGHSEATAEWIDGPLVLDCTGFSLDIVSSTTTGGDVTLKVWLSK